MVFVLLSLTHTHALYDPLRPVRVVTSIRKTCYSFVASAGLGDMEVWEYVRLDPPLDHFLSLLLGVVYDRCCDTKRACTYPSEFAAITAHDAVSIVVQNIITIQPVTKPDSSHQHAEPQCQFQAAEEPHQFKPLASRLPMPVLPALDNTASQPRKPPMIHHATQSKSDLTESRDQISSLVVWSPTSLCIVDMPYVCAGRGSVGSAEEDA